ncbi:hypothetical protein FI667_g5607, partial [Globisporangium splendens]
MSRGGRKRSAIWEHFLLGRNADGNRVAQCNFCSRIMKSQPDRMENHFLKLCAHVDAEHRRQWMQDREHRAAIARAAAALKQQEYEAVASGAVVSGAISSVAAVAGSSAVVADPAVTEYAVAGSSEVSPVPVPVGKRDANGTIVAVQEDEEVVQHDPELSTTSPVVKKARKSSAKGGSATKKRQQQGQTQQGQQRSSFSILKEVNGKPERVELENLRLMKAESELEGQELELKKRKAEIEERKSELQLESMRYDNDMKRIKVAEENMLARKRLRDAGVPQEEIEMLLPLRPTESVPETLI